MTNPTKEREAGPSEIMLLAQRLTYWCEAHGIKDTLGTLGEICWVLGVDFNLVLTPRDSDRSGEAVETTGSTEGESTGLQGIAETQSPTNLKGE